MEETTKTRSRTRWRALALVGAFSLLLAQFIVWAGPAPAQVTGVLYGADGSGNDAATLYTINPADGTKTATMGLIGFKTIGLAVDPITGQLYGSTGADDDVPGALIKIDKQTGEGTLIGDGEIVDCIFGAGMHDIAFTTDGQLWGWSACNDTLVEINKVTGDGEEIGTGISGSGNGFAADPDDDTLWLTPDDDDGQYYTVDKATGDVTSEGTLDGDNDGNINALAWSCDGETLYGNANIESGLGPREFITINTATDHITVLGGPAGIDPQQAALAWDCAPPAPAPAPAPAAVTCKGKTATITGTAGNETLTGTGARDIVAALGGNDTVQTKGGKDLVCAGKGKDKAAGGGGKDKLLGQGGKDRLKGGGGNDTLRGGKGRDRCNGGAGTDKGNCEVERNIP
jgi:Ca2+-binding RTX toxin-like protein